MTKTITRTDKAFYWYLENGFPFSEEQRNYKEMLYTPIYQYFKNDYYFPEEMLIRVENSSLPYEKFEIYMKLFSHRMTYFNYKNTFNVIWNYDIENNIELQEMDFISHVVNRDIPIEDALFYIGKNYSKNLLFKIQRALYFNFSHEDIQENIIENKEVAEKYMTLDEVDDLCIEIRIMEKKSYVPLQSNILHDIKITEYNSELNDFVDELRLLNETLLDNTEVLEKNISSETGEQEMKISKLKLSYIFFGVPIGLYIFMKVMKKERGK